MLKGNKIIYFEKINSTNDYLKNSYKKLKNGTIVVSKIQTNGRGRLGRNWVSNEGGLWFSILVKRNLKKPNFYTKLSSIVILNVLKNLNINAKIKWPNDIYVNSKKLSGILTEAISFNNKIKCIIIGIGINVNNDVPKNGISIYHIKNKKINPNDFLKLFIKEYNKNFLLFSLFSPLLNIKWKKNLMFKKGDKIEGYKIIKIFPDFLLLEKNKKRIKIRSIHELEKGGIND
ncbi:biotin--acetyl-CoA-carboxylase ligase [Thermosipho affectus]|uniref:Biotin--acetyl-CoA-carboxylase ligase n=1 Tax=Thermosipho affectus TaxID=660294 RepID=A0ABX3IFC0_9BACT|nr:biotin--[acetyl-CoA-carboxylase] ligase [Thermosipho affectus]ONN26521.1 biotin--acetyl-CoA-carboxylase ligase [Thermosipho affectus]